MQPIKATPRQHFAASASSQLLPARHSSHQSLLTPLLLELSQPGNLKCLSHVDHPQALTTSNCSLRHQVKTLMQACLALQHTFLLLPEAPLWFAALRQADPVHYPKLSSYSPSLSLPVPPPFYLLMHRDRQANKSLQTRLWEIQELYQSHSICLMLVTKLERFMLFELYPWSPNKN